MAEEGFLRRWSRMKATGGEVAEAPPSRSTSAPARPSTPAPPAAPTPAAAPARADASRDQAALPTLDDVARLTPESDFSAFVAQGVDKSVQRLALKKLFADPHFRVMDGLDMYMDDYNKPSPMSAAMLAALEHAKSALRPSEPHRPQAQVVAAQAPDAAAMAAPEPAAADGINAAPAPERQAEPGMEPETKPETEPKAEPETVAARDATPSGETVPGIGAPHSAPEETGDLYAPSAPPACIQTGIHPQSLQGQA